MKNEVKLVASAEVADVAAVPRRGLAVIQALLERLHGAQIRYCHWKSNEHLEAAADGLTDLDVLFEARRQDDLQRILAESGFRRFQATAATAYPAVEDYLAVDDATGTLVHLHLHHRLTLGQPHLKGYRLPWEEDVLVARRFDPDCGIYTASPEHELLLLLVRDALKRRLRSRVADWVRRGPATGDLAREFEWLADRADLDEVAALAARLIGPQAEVPLRDLVTHGLRREARSAFAAAVRPALRRYRTFGVVSAVFLAKWREAVWILGGLSRRYFHWAIPLRRTSPRGGITVVFLGADGSGKSTLTADVAVWLSQKIDVVPIYFGSGDGPASLVRLPFLLARRLVDRRVPSGSPAQRRSGSRGRLRSIALIPWALSLGLEKRGKLRRMIRARNRGMVVVCDRFPQDQIKGFNDGCLLGQLANSPNRLARALSAWEARGYAASKLDPPDLVIKMIASPGVAQSRRPEMSTEEIDDRIAAVRSLQFPERTRVVEVDADRPLDEVTGSVRRLVWEVL